MHRMTTASLLLLAACAAAPRVSTEGERRIATQTLDLVGIAVASMQATGQMLTPEQFALAQSQLAELRLAIAESETTPIEWTSIAARVAALAIQWLPSRVVEAKSAK